MIPAIPIPPETPITVTLEAQEWNTIMFVLQDAPYKVVAGIMNKTVAQVQEGAARAAHPNPMPEIKTGAMNGATEYDGASIPGAYR